jgi:hypothetical protein
MFHRLGAFYRALRNEDARTPDEASGVSRRDFSRRFASGVLSALSLVFLGNPVAAAERAGAAVDLLPKRGGCGCACAQGCQGAGNGCCGADCSACPWGGACWCQGSDPFWEWCCDYYCECAGMPDSCTCCEPVSMHTCFFGPPPPPPCQ